MDIEFKKIVKQIVSSEGCFKHCYRGNPSGGRLWTVWKNSHLSDNFGPKYIVVYKLTKLVKYWCYTSCSELFGLNDGTDVDCPLKYLDIVPCPKDKNAAQWRAKVYEYHNNRIAKRLAKKEAKNAEKKVAKTLLTKKGKDTFDMMFWSTPKQYPNVFSKYLEKSK